MTELDVIKKKIREHLNNLADDLASGAAVDFPHYKYITGMITGLAMVERDIVEFQRSVEDED